MPILLVGATGLVGRRLGRLLLGSGAAVEALVRRPSGLAGASWSERVAPPERWPELIVEIAPRAAVSCLGTTMREAGSRAAFRAVDRDLVLAVARAARAAGAVQMASVSSAGADPDSRSFYLRCKGETDAALAGLGFASLDIFRPGLLRGPRGGDRRLGERIGIAASYLVNPFLLGPLDRYAAIEADRVAAAIAAALAEPRPGLRLHDNRAIRRLAAAIP